MRAKQLQHVVSSEKCALRESNSLQAGLESATLSNEYRAQRLYCFDYKMELARVNRL